MAAPNPRARSTETGTIAVGGSHSLTWSDCAFEADLNAYYRVLDITGARNGASYTAKLTGSGPIQVFVLDSEGELVTYAMHPDAAAAAPSLTWEYRTGDFLLVVSDEAPVAAPTARLTLTEYRGGSWVSGTATSLTTEVSGTLEASDRSLPYHGGHYDAVMQAPKGAEAGQLMYLEFAGDDADWLSVVVLNSSNLPVGEYWVEDGWVAFPLESGERFVVTSQLPDDFGDYAFTWEVLPDPAVITQADSNPHWWDLNRVPFYPIKWTATTSHITPETLQDGRVPSSYRVEVSGDGGETWQAAALSGHAVAENSAEVELWEGDWLVRVVRESMGYEVESDAVEIHAWGDRAGWTVTSLQLTLPTPTSTPGKPDGYRDLTGAVSGTETYRDGRTRALEPRGAFQVQFRYSGSSSWHTLAYDWTSIALPGSGTVRVVSGSVVSNEVPVTVHKSTATYKGTFATPTRAAAVPGAMDFRGTITQRLADGSWRTALDGTWYKVQHYSGGKWRTIHSAQTSSANPGVVEATVVLAGKGKYRIVSGKSVLKTWTLKPVAPTRTAKVATPTLSPAGTNRYAVRVEITQKFADGRWGAGKPGWTYKVQQRDVGAKKWRSDVSLSASKAAPFDAYVRTKGGPHEVRIVATYKGRTYTSPVARTA